MMYFTITTFLVRWLFLCNLIRDASEIQTLPQQLYSPLPSAEQALPLPTQHQHQPQHYEQHHQHQQQQQFSNNQKSAASSNNYNLDWQQGEYAWRDQCIRGILSYPPGPQRMLVVDALRVDLVQLLTQQLQAMDQTMQRQIALESISSKSDATSECDEENDKGKGDSFDDKEKDTVLDADEEIIQAFEKEALVRDGDSTKENVDTNTQPNNEDKREAVLLNSKGDAHVLDSNNNSAANNADQTPVNRQPTPPSSQEIQEARTNKKHVQEYLPQLVSAVLKSPPAVDPGLANPVEKLKQLMLDRCLKDPSWGIELCWLLEAEVGRAWKTLFEHRQQTGRRLIVVLPAERAAVMAAIGTEKRETFDLLQDAEQATAYGYTPDATEEFEAAPPAWQTATSSNPIPPPAWQQQSMPWQHEQQTLYHNAEESQVGQSHHHPSRLPSSISLRRCGHFGDTMCFVDRLTQISIDLKRVPTPERHAYLLESLHEVNRRIRRRMVTHGDVSLDVDDYRSPYDWPHVEDLTMDMLQYSIHFPLDPQTGSWSNGEPQTINERMPNPPSTKTVRVLNIVVEESRMLASRERCPFLVHLEVADTGLEGNDARLYTSGVGGLGTTLEEALSMDDPSAVTASQRHQLSYKIPPELLSPSHRSHSTDQHQSMDNAHSSQQLDPAEDSANSENSFPRGGWTADVHDEVAGADYNMYPNSYDDARQHEYEQAYQKMQEQQQVLPAQTVTEEQSFSTGTELLDKIFGIPWDEKCRGIRDASPYGHVKGWRLASFIMKAGEDIRREALVMQIISKLRLWFEAEIPEKHRPFMRPYTIMSVGGDAGLVECLSDAKSIDEVKKQTDGFISLKNYFERAYGPPSQDRQPNGFGPPYQQQSNYERPQSSNFPTESLSFEKAQDNFLRSLVGYSLVCYILQIKDRHSANILLDREGHIMHIDFGFVLGDTPKMGKVPIFNEKAPFKLNTEFWEVLGGWNIDCGGLGARFCKMFELAFASASAHVEEIASLVEATMLLLNPNPRTAQLLANGVRNRLRMRGPPGSPVQQKFVMELVSSALRDWGTSTYDWMQQIMNGYQ